MERTISPEERIRRAEEIYNRRRSSNGIRVSSDKVNSSKKQISLFKKMLMQLAICSVIYIIFYLIKNTNYIFSEDVINKTREFLSYDINFGNIQSSISSFWNDNKDKFNFFGIFGDEQEDTTTNEVQANDLQSEANEILNETINNNEIDETNADENNNAIGIGGAETNEIVEEDSTDEQKSQSELDIEYLKEKYSFIVPVTGTITSRFGKREETEVVSANHQGIDIGANEGTPIYASMDGTVEVASEEGEYGKHIDIVNGDVLTRYAHCSKLLVEEGDEVKQGDKIAEVGSTGNSTGPHLHFEIRRDDRIINPESILDFD